MRRMAEASSSSSSIAALDLAPRQLAIGQIYVPKRPIGFVGPEAPVQYPAKWQDYIEAVIKKRGDKPIRLYADGERIGGHVDSSRRNGCSGLVDQRYRQR